MALSGYSSTISKKTQTCTTHHPVAFGNNETYLRQNSVSVKYGHGASVGELLNKISSVVGARRASTTSLLDVSTDIAWIIVFGIFSLYELWIGMPQDSKFWNFAHSVCFRRFQLSRAASGVLGLGFLGYVQKNLQLLIDGWWRSGGFWEASWACLSIHWFVVCFVACLGMTA